jgi:hypothetical protein
MSLSESEVPLQVDLDPSRLLHRAIILMHGVTVPCLIVLPWPWWLSLLAGASAAVAGYLHCRHLRRNSVTRLIREEDGRWTLGMCDGMHGGYRLLPDTYVHPRLTVLNFSGPDSRSVVLLADSLEPAAFRRLRVMLKLRGAGLPASAQDGGVRIVGAGR